jgi:hypothetical protein
MTVGRAAELRSYATGRLWERPRRLHERSAIAETVRNAYLAAGGDCPTGGQWVWTAHRATWIGKDAVVKLARAPHGELLLQQEESIRGRIHGAPSAAGWQDKVPYTLAAGRRGGRFVVVEERIPGASLEPLMHDPVFQQMVQDEMTEIRQTTAHELLADDNRLLTWFVGPARNVEGVLRRWGRPELGRRVVAWAHRAAEQLRGETCRVSLVHGDMWPGNALLHDGRVSGLIDWDQAAFHDAALHDALHLQLLPTARERRIDLGCLVREALQDVRTEREMFDAFRQGDLEGCCRDTGIGARDALTWYWLRHVARMAPEPGHGNNPRWVTRNVVAVASALDNGKAR